MCSHSLCPVASTRRPRWTSIQRTKCIKRKLSMHCQQLLRTLTKEVLSSFFTVHTLKIKYIELIGFRYQLYPSTNFSLAPYFPLVLIGSGRSVPTPALSMMLEKVQVLVIDDSITIQKVLSLWFVQHNCICKVASNGSLNYYV